MTQPSQKRAEYRNINALSDLPSYRLPAAGWVSILHRISGLLMFVLLPVVVWMLDMSLTSEMTYERLSGAVSGVFAKVVVLVLLWGYLHHFTAGVRHLYMDMTHSVSKGFGRSSAVVTLVVSVGLTVVLGAKVFGVY